MHEIGYALGLGHSNDQNFVMYALYNDDNIKLELQTDDIHASQNLYNPAAPVVPTTSTTAKTVPAHKLCNLTNVQQCLIINQFMYVFYKEWFWMINTSITDATYNEPPQLITDWLIFFTRDIQGNFWNISETIWRSGHICC
jgi:hypothetical protein